MKFPRFGICENRRLLLVFAVLIVSTPAMCMETVDVSIPSSVSFNVYDVTQQSTGFPNPSTAEFSDATLIEGNALRMSVKSDSNNFTRPGSSGGYISADKIAWMTSNALNGTGYPGSMSSATYTRVYQSAADAILGSVDITWTLDAPGGGILAGEHSLVATWKIESL